MNRKFIYLLVLICLESSSCVRQEKYAPPFSVLNGRTITLKPTNATFFIPQEWLKRFKLFKNNLHLSRQQLELIEYGKGEWDERFSKIVNTLLPFERCSFHGGGDGWGEQAVAYSDLQMRAYIGRWKASELHDLISSVGLAEAKKLSEKASMEQTKVDGWQVSALSFPLWFHDYGATAKVDFYSRKYRKTTIILVFMYTSFRGRQKHQLREVLESFEFSEAKSKNKQAQQGAP